MPETLVIFVMGPTCAGKSTLLQLAAARSESVGLVEVGKTLRAKYPPSYFAGQNNPKHTADEAWDICEKEVFRLHSEGKRVILVDGQPRDIPQVGLCCTRFLPETFSTAFLLVDASLEERERRAREHRSGEDLETLALPRLTNDMIAYYSVMVELAKRDKRVIVFDSTNPKGLSEEVLFEPVVKAMLTWEAAFDV